MIQRIPSSAALMIIFLPCVFSQAFTEVSEAAGINHAFRVDLANFGGGVTVFDFNNDGYEDFYLPGGNELDHLYRNNGDGTFTNVFEISGLDSTIPLHTQGAAAADIDRDGDKDLLITTLYTVADRELSPNLLFLNNGDGTFTDVTRQFGLSKYVSNSEGVTFGDINADGFPDMYIANYIASSPKGVSIFNENTITQSFVSAKDFLFINASGQKFIEVSQLYGLDHRGFGFQGIFTDWDNDQDQDLYIANDFGYRAQPNYALRNDYPRKSMSYVTEDLSLNYGMNAMGIALTDYNFDGWMDYYVTNINASLFVANIDGESFIDIGYQLGIAQSLINNPDYRGVPVSWGANFFDYDHDGDEDLFVNNGALNPTVRLNHNFFFKNEATRFIEIGEELQLDDPRIGRGSAIFDYDNDGDMDLIVVNQYARDPTETMAPARTLLYRNDASDGNWLKVALSGVHAEKNGIGSKIIVDIGIRKLTREIDGGSSHLSQNSTIAHFGLGEAEELRSITVKWLGGKTQILKNVKANQLLTIVEQDNQPSSDTADNSMRLQQIGTDRLLIEYSIADVGPIEIKLYNMQGQLVDVLMPLTEGIYEGLWQWDMNPSMPSGIYIVVLEASQHILSERIFKN